MKSLKFSTHLLILVFIFGCSNEFLDRKPLSKLVTENYYKTEQDLFQAVVACYANTKTQRWYGHFYAYLNEIASDDCLDKDSPDALDNFQWTSAPNNFLRSGIGAGANDLFAVLWRSYYEGILRANLVLSRGPGIDMDKSKRDVMLAEAYFFRGFAYWHLATGFGDAPIFTKEVTDINDIYTKRAPVDEVFKQAESDFIEAIKYLPNSWDASFSGRVTKWAAIAMLGKSYLFHASYDNSYFAKAAEQFKLIIDSKQFSLLPNYGDVFALDNEFNKETIFEIVYTDRGQAFNTFYQDGGTANQNTERDRRFGIQGADGQRAYGEVIATRDLVFEFEFRDPRMPETVWFVRADSKEPYDSSLTGYTSDNNLKSNIKYLPAMNKQLAKTGGSAYIGEYYHIKKAVNGYVGSADPGNSGNNWRLIRYSDILLMFAEASVEAYGLNTEAINALNEVRSRARNMVNSSSNLLSQLATISGPSFDLTKGDEVLPTKEILAGDRYSASTGVLMPFPLTPSDPPLFIWSVRSIRESADTDFINYSYNLEDFRKAIVHERRVELATEYHRFPDLRRWQILKEKSGIEHPGAATSVFSTKLFGTDDIKTYLSKHNLNPIPQFQLDLNTELKQNPGY